MPPGGSCLERAARSLTRSDGGVLRGPEESAPAPRLPPWLSREEAAPRPPPLPARIGEHRPPSKSTAGTLREAGCGRRCPHGHLWAPMGTQAAGQQLYICAHASIASRLLWSLVTLFLAGFWFALGSLRPSIES